MNVRKLLVYPLLIIFAINPAHAAIRLQHAGDDSKFINISKSGEENVVFQYCEGEEDCRQMGPLESYPLASLEEVRTCNESENDLFHAGLFAAIPALFTPFGIFAVYAAWKGSDELYPSICHVETNLILTHFLHDSDDLDGEETFVWEFESLVEMEEMFSIWETEDLKKMKAKLTNILEATAEFSQSGNASSQAYKEQEEDDWMNQHYGD